MNDRELLELAAKASGFEVRFETRMSFGGNIKAPVIKSGEHWGEWDPLADDADALRLAVRLRIPPHIDCNMTEAEAATEANGGFFGEPHLDDPYAATRRAIVRAAAAIAQQRGSGEGVS